MNFHLFALRQTRQRREVESYKTTTTDTGMARAKLQDLTNSSCSGAPGLQTTKGINLAIRITGKCFLRCFSAHLSGSENTKNTVVHKRPLRFRVSVPLEPRLAVCFFAAHELNYMMQKL